MPDHADGTFSTFLTPPAIARRFGVKPAKVLRWIARGELHAVNVGDGQQRPRWRISPDALSLFEQQRASPSPAPPKPRRRRVRAEALEFFGGVS